MSRNDSNRKRKSQADDQPRPRTASEGTDEVVTSSSTPTIDSFLEGFKKPVGSLAALKKVVEEANGVKNNLIKLRNLPSQKQTDKILVFLNKEKLEEMEASCKLLGVTLNWAQLKEFVANPPETGTQGLVAIALFGCDILDPITLLFNNLKQIREDLKVHAALSNKSETGTRTAEEAKLNIVGDQDFKDMMEGVHIPSPSKPEKDLEAFLKEDKEDIKPWWPGKKPEKGKLEELSCFWNNLIIDSEKLKPESLKKKEVDRTVQALLDWEAPDHKRCSVFGNKKLCFPTDVSSEKEAVQPILGALLRALSLIRVEGSSLQGRSDQRRERYMPATGTRPKRFVDFESTPLTPFTPVLLNQEISLIKEVKNVRRKAQDAKYVHDEVCKQMCGHLGKRTLVAFDIGDVGVDSKSVGLIMTPVYMQVICLSLKNMGTENAFLDIEKTRLMPLVNEEAFDKLLQNDADKEALRPLLFQDGDTSSDLPEGMLHLWRLLHSSDADLGVLFFDGTHQKATFRPEGEGGCRTIGKLLGSGSQGLVYEVANAGSEEADAGREDVVKASVAGEMRYIKREIKALQALAGGCPYIPLLKHIGRIQYTIRETVAEVPAFSMTPKGSPALQRFSSVKPEEKAIALLTLWANGSNALEFAHKKKIYHLDVSPRNFIFDHHNHQYLLIDWGCSALDAEQVQGFRGSLPFAHAEIHAKSNTQAWSPAAEHDKASLLFSICALEKGNLVPWSGFNSRLGKNDKAFEKRRMETMNTLKTLIDNYPRTDNVPSISLYGKDVKEVRSGFNKKIWTDIENA